MKRKALLMIVLLAFIFLFSGFRQTQSMDEFLKSAAAKIAAHIKTIKQQPDTLFFAKSDLPIKEQEKLGKADVKKIKKLLDVQGFDSPDYDKIMELTTEILLKAPDTQYAQMANWNIHTYDLIYENQLAARDALLSYLEKYKTSESMKKEAYDKLANFAADDKEWDLVLYYSEKYLEMEPDSYPRLLNKARALVNLVFLKEGKSLLNCICDEDPGSVQANLAVSALDALSPANFDPDLLAKYKETANRLRQIGTAIEMYHLDQMKYPKSLQDLVPLYMEKLYEVDAWGHKLILKLDLKNERMLIASPGSDGRFEGFDQEGEYIDIPGKDIIFGNGFPLFAPRLKNP